MLFGLGALGCAFAHSFEMLVTARLIQGLGLQRHDERQLGIDPFHLAEAHPRRGVGVNAMVVSTGVTLGRHLLPSSLFAPCRGCP